MFKRLSAVLSEPVVQFLLAGAVLYALVHIQATPEDALIQVSLAEQEKIYAQFQRNHRKPPSADEQGAALDALIDEAVLVREAERLGLGENDDIVERRLLQKMKFVLEARSQPEAPTSAELQAFYEQHRADYVQPARYTIEHIYFRAGARSKARAEAYLKQTRAGAEWAGRADKANAAGDHFDFGNRLVDRTLAELRDIFGPGFVQALRGRESNRDSFGPVSSLYGEHIVRVINHTPERQLDFEAAGPAVHADWLRAEQKRLQQAEIARLRQRYRIHIESPDAAH